MNSQTFFSLFNLIENKDYFRKYIWDDKNREVGFTLLKYYPKDKAFKPSKNKNGDDDTVIMIKVYTFPKEGKNTDWMSGVSVSKASLYQIDNSTGFISQEEETNNPKVPDKDSLSKSLKSSQPIDLEDNNRFYFNPENKTFFDNYKKNTVEPSFIVNYIYQEHIATYSSFRGYVLKTKVKIKNLFIILIEKFAKCLIIIIPVISGRKIENESYGFIFFPFYFVNTNVNGLNSDNSKKDKLEEYDNLLRKINPLTFSFVTGIILFFYILYYNFCVDLLGIISFIKANKDDQIFSVSLIAFTVLLFNYMLPNFLLFLLNKLVVLYKKVSLIKFKL